jgi:hypothetical protein
VPWGYVPAVGEFGAHLLQVRVAHIFHREDEDVLETICRLLHTGEELLRQFFALLVRLGQVHDLRALGFGHVDAVAGGLGGRVAVKKKVRCWSQTSDHNLGGEFLASLRTWQPRLKPGGQVQLSLPTLQYRKVATTMLRR